MSYKYQQTKEAKINLQSDILDFLQRYPGVTFTRQELCAVFDRSDRSVRAELERIANYYPIRATAGRKGYSLICWNENTTDEELKEIGDECSKQIAELQHRIDSLNARLKPLIAALKVIDEKVYAK